jgi:transcriptional regulator with XRE-family HTH domain
MRDKKLPTKIFGEVLQELRLQQALTQDQLAERAGTERSHISALERAQFPAGQLEEHVLQVRRPVQGAQAGPGGEVGEQRRGVLDIAEGGFAADFDAARKACASRAAQPGASSP